MTNRIRSVAGLGFVALALASGSLAAQGRGHGRGNGAGDDRILIPQSNDNGRRVPPGLAKKPGGMPPGQYKKYRSLDGANVLRDVLINRGYTVVRTSPYGESQYVYYRTPNGAVRRAVVRPGANRLSFGNVPDALVREVLARLY